MVRMRPAVKRRMGKVSARRSARDRRGVSAGLALLVVMVITLDPANAYAYLDMGTGSMLFQVVVATAAGALFSVKIYWRQIRARFAGESDPSEEPEADEGDTDAG